MRTQVRIRRRLILKPPGVAVYRIHDYNGKLLYVGMTEHLTQRMASHQQTQPWWPAVWYVDWEEFPNLEAAAKEEQRLIRTLRPPKNQQHIGKLKRVTQARWSDGRECFKP